MGDIKCQNGRLTTVWTDLVLPIDHKSPRSAYIHVPFCAHRCGYCNFTLVSGRDDLIEAYLAALERELSLLQTPRQVDTLYLGGGTPTHPAPDQLDRLLRLCLHWHPVADDGELTVEANPADLDDVKVDVLAAANVSRVSLGAQSFASQKLRLLERDHDQAAIIASAESIRSIGAQLAIDLIFAAPGETVAQWRLDLQRAIELRPDHVSTYGLTFEQGTAFWTRRQKEQLCEVDEEPQRQMYELAIDTLIAAGYEHYEISNFALPGNRSRHNQTYWTGAPYYAAGPGAARYIAGRRETNHRSTTTWIKRLQAGQSPVAEWDELSAEARARELLVIGLRRLDGVTRRDFKQRTGFELDALSGKTVAQYATSGWLTDDGDRVRLTRQGLLISDALWPELL